MEGRLVIGWLWRSQNITERSVKNKDELMRRLITTKASNRAAVHGTKRPVTETINVLPPKEETDKGKEEKEKKREEVEKTVDSQIREHLHDKPYSPVN
ncbi:conserved hypothetical protein [Ricinus communis]|uniref:Uncharacterized protein n=1 Tax=Ricinus communis TaxID=3988 RepID=B9TGS9_RICCO|nr:conserved hypothetical protein [Ricinus communis]